MQSDEWEIQMMDMRLVNHPGGSTQSGGKKSIRTPTYQKLDRMIENIQKYREEFECTRQPAFLMEQKEKQDYLAHRFNDYIRKYNKFSHKLIIPPSELKRRANRRRESNMRTLKMKGKVLGKVLTSMSSSRSLLSKSNNSQITTPRKKKKKPTIPTISTFKVVSDQRRGSRLIKIAPKISRSQVRSSSISGMKSPTFSNSNSKGKTTGGFKNFPKHHVSSNNLLVSNNSLKERRHRKSNVSANQVKKFIAGVPSGGFGANNKTNMTQNSGSLTGRSSLKPPSLKSQRSSAFRSSQLLSSKMRKQLDENLDRAVIKVAGREKKLEKSTTVFRISKGDLFAPKGLYNYVKSQIERDNFHDRKDEDKMLKRNSKVIRAYIRKKRQMMEDKGQYSAFGSRSPHYESSGQKKTNKRSRLKRMSLSTLTYSYLNTDKVSSVSQKRASGFTPVRLNKDLNLGFPQPKLNNNKNQFKRSSAAPKLKNKPPTIAKLPTLAEAAQFKRRSSTQIMKPLVSRMSTREIPSPKLPLADCAGWPGAAVQRKSSKIVDQPINPMKLPKTAATMRAKIQMPKEISEVKKEQSSESSNGSPKKGNKASKNGSEGSQKEQRMAKRAFTKLSHSSSSLDSYLKEKRDATDGEALANLPLPPASPPKFTKKPSKKGRVTFVVDTDELERDIEARSNITQNTRNEWVNSQFPTSKGLTLVLEKDVKYERKRTSSEVDPSLMRGTTFGAVAHSVRKLSTKILTPDLSPSNLMLPIRDGQLQQPEMPSVPNLNLDFTEVSQNQVQRGPLNIRLPLQTESAAESRNEVQQLPQPAIAAPKEARTHQPILAQSLQSSTKNPVIIIQKNPTLLRDLKKGKSIEIGGQDLETPTENPYTAPEALASLSKKFISNRQKKLNRENQAKILIKPIRESQSSLQKTINYQGDIHYGANAPKPPPVNSGGVIFNIQSEPSIHHTAADTNLMTGDQTPSSMPLQTKTTEPAGTYTQNPPSPRHNNYFRKAQLKSNILAQSAKLGSTASATKTRPMSSIKQYGQPMKASRPGTTDPTKVSGRRPITGIKDPYQLDKVIKQHEESIENFKKDYDHFQKTLQYGPSGSQSSSVLQDPILPQTSKYHTISPMNSQRPSTVGTGRARQKKQVSIYVDRPKSQMSTRLFSSQRPSGYKLDVEDLPSIKFIQHSNKQFSRMTDLFDQKSQAIKAQLLTTSQQPTTLQNCDLNIYGTAEPSPTVPLSSALHPSNPYIKERYNYPHLKPCAQAKPALSQASNRSSQPRQGQPGKTRPTTAVATARARKPPSQTLRTLQSTQQSVKGVSSTRSVRPRKSMPAPPSASSRPQQTRSQSAFDPPNFYHNLDLVGATEKSYQQLQDETRLGLKLNDMAGVMDTSNLQTYVNTLSQRRKSAKIKSLSNVLSKWEYTRSLKNSRQVLGQPVSKREISTTMDRELSYYDDYTTAGQFMKNEIEPVNRQIQMMGVKKRKK